MRFANATGTNQEHVLMGSQESALRQLQEPNLGDTRHERKVKILQTLLVREGSGFEPLAQVLLMALSQFTFEQGLQVAHIAQTSLLSFASQRLTISCDAVQTELLEIGNDDLIAQVFSHGCTSNKRL